MLSGKIFGQVQSQIQFHYFNFNLLKLIGSTKLNYVVFTSELQYEKYNIKIHLELHN